MLPLFGTHILLKTLTYLRGFKENLPDLWWLPLNCQCNQNVCLKNLQERRRDLRLAFLFKVVHGHVGVTPDDMGLIKRTKEHERTTDSISEPWGHPLLLLNFPLRYAQLGIGISSQLRLWSQNCQLLSKLRRTGRRLLRLGHDCIHPSFARYSTRRPAKKLTRQDKNRMCGVEADPAVVHISKYICIYLNAMFMPTIC